MEGAISLIFVIPGKKAASIRSKFASVIHRYIAGDKSLVCEINANSKSVAPVNQIARNALGMKIGLQDNEMCKMSDPSTVHVIRTVADIVNEAHNKTLRAKDETLQAKDATLHAKDDTLQAKDQTIHLQSGMIELQQRNVDLLHSLLNQ